MHSYTKVFFGFCLFLSLEIALTAQTVDLSGLSSTNLPAGTSMTWHSAKPPSTGNQIDPATATTGTTYYTYFYDATNGCYSDTGTAIRAQCEGTTPTVTNLPAGTIVTYHSGIPVSTANQVTPTTGLYYGAFYDATNVCFSNEVSYIFFATCTTPELTNTCPSSSLTFADVASHATNIPANATVTLHTALPASASNLATDPITSTGTYYVAFYDATDNCYSGSNGDGSAATEITVTISNCLTITANDDNFTAQTPGSTTPTVFTNDDAGGITPATASLATAPTVQNDGGLTGISFNADGTATIPGGATQGTYMVTYQICLAADNAICDVAVMTVEVTCGVPIPVLSKL